MDSIDSLIKAANAADTTAKAYRTVSNSQEFRDAANKATQANEEMVTSTKKVVDAQKEQAKSLAEVRKLTEAAAKAAQDQTGTLNQNINLQIQLKNELADVTKQLKDSKKGYVDNGANVGDLTKRQNELRIAINDNNRTIRNQIKEVNAADGSINQMRANLNLLTQTYDDLSEADRNGIVGKEMLAGMDALSTKLKELEGATGRFQRNVGNYPETFGEVGESFNSAFGEFKSGNIQGGIDGTKTAMNGLVASARAFIASPIGLAVAALAAIGLAAKAVWDYNEGLRENLTLTEQFTGATGASADAIRQQAQAMTDTFGGEFKENLNAAQKLVEAFGISYEEAFDQVAKGLASGGMANEEFFDSINEYPQLFAKAGYSAEEFLNLINVGFEQGLYSDKLVDGIKEADLALKEQTKTTRDALVNAFGDVWTDDLLRRIKTGETTTKDALIEIANQAQETGLNHQQLYQLTADVFKGAGEDAGGAAKYFDILNDSVGNLGEPLTETGQHLLALKDANVELQVAMDAALKSDSVISFTQQWDVAWVKIQTGFFEIVSAARKLYEWYDRVSDRSGSLMKIWDSLQALGDRVSKVFDYFSTTVGRLAEKLGISSGEANGFLKVVTYLTDPIKMLDLLLQGVVWWVEKFTDGLMAGITYAESFGRTLIQLATFDLDNLKGIGENAQDIKNENAEYSKRIQLEKNRKTILEGINETIERFSLRAKEIIESEKAAQKLADDEKMKAAEENAKKQADLQKKYAADEKKRRDQAAKDAEKAAKDRFDEEVRLMDATLKHYQLTSGNRLSLDESFSASMITAQKNYLDEVYIMELEKAEKVSRLDIENVRRKLDNGEKLTSNELSLINYEIELAKKLGDEKKKIDADVAAYTAKRATENFEAEKKRLALDLIYKITGGEDKIKAEEDYNREIERLALERFEKITGLNRQEVLDKLAQKKELSAIEKEYIDFITQLQNNAFSKRKTDAKNELTQDEQTAKIKKDLSIAEGENRKKVEEQYLQDVYDANREYLDSYYGFEHDKVLAKFKSGEQLTAAETEYLGESLELNKEHKEALQELELGYQEKYLEMIGASLGAEKEIREVFLAYKKYLEYQDLEFSKEKALAQMEIVAAVAGAGAAILGEQTAFGKALAIAQVAFNTAIAITRAYSDLGPVAGTVFAAIIGTVSAIQINKIASAKVPEAPKFSASFATGVYDSSFQGRALVDEEGPELHYDRYGRLKSSGKSRPNIRDVKKGDTIFPADISKKIKEISNYNPIPDLLTGIDFRNSNSDNGYQFEKIESKLDKLGRIMQNKPGFVFDGKNIIAVSGGSGSTHQRPLPNFKNEKPKQETIK